MKVCFLCGGFSKNGGIGRVISVLSDKLVEENDIEVYLCSFYKREATSYYKLNPYCKQDSLYPHMISMTNAMLTGHAVKKLCEYVYKNNIDIIIACGALFYPIAVLSAKKTKIQCICWEHTNPRNKSDYKFQDLARSFGAKRSDCNIVLTKSALQVYQTRFSKSRNIQIYNPIDPELMKGTVKYNCTSKKIISVGRLRPQKNFSRLLDIASVVLTNHPDWEWDIFGDGPLKNELEKKKESLQLGNQVHFCGQVSDLYERYQQYSFMVMTSDYEGFPMTLLEGAANCLPMISFDIPTGPSEIIVDSVNGFLCDKGDVEQMIKVIDDLISDDKLREKMSSASKKTAEQFETEGICNQWIKILNGIMKYQI